MNMRILEISDMVRNMSEKLSAAPEVEATTVAATSPLSTTEMGEISATTVKDLTTETTPMTNKKQELIKSILSKIIATGGEGGDATKVEAKGGEGGRIEIIF